MRRLLERPHFRSWLALIGVTTFIFGTIFVLMQQTARFSANDRPTEIANIASERLRNGADPSDVMPEVNTNTKTTSLPFVIVTTQDREVLANSLDIDGNFNSLPPKGVFDSALNHQNLITWRPTNNVRLATTVNYIDTGAKKYFVVTGQSLKYTEEKIATYAQLTVAGWIASISWMTLVYFFAGHLHEQTSKSHKSSTKKS